MSLNQYNLNDRYDSSQFDRSETDPSLFEYESDPLEVYAAMYDPDFDLGETVRAPRNPKAKASKQSRSPN